MDSNSKKEDIIPSSPYPERGKSISQKFAHELEENAVVAGASEKWSRFSDSNMSDRHITERERREVRTSSLMLTIANVCKTFFGISGLATPKFISEAGIEISLVVILAICLLNLYTTWLLIKARNRFKNRPVSTLAQLGSLLYGE